MAAKLSVILSVTGKKSL